MRMTNAPKAAMRAFLGQHLRSQLWLAQEMGISDALVSAVINGWRAASPAFRRKFKRITGIDLADFPCDKLGRLTGKPARPAPADPEPDPELISA